MLADNQGATIYGVPPSSSINEYAAQGFTEPTIPVLRPDQPERAFFPGYEGLPYVGRQAPLVREDDPDHLKPVEVKTACIKIFKLNDPADLVEYNRIWDLISKGLYVFSEEERQWVAEEKTWFVYLRWAAIVMKDPKAHQSDLAAMYETLPK